MTGRILPVPGVTLYARRIPANVAGPKVSATVEHPAQPWQRTAFYWDPADTTATAWTDGIIMRHRKFYRLNGVAYRLEHLS